MARSESVLLTVALVLTLSCRARSAGLVATIYSGKNGPTNSSAVKVEVTPSPKTGTSPGCTNLPAGWVSRSVFLNWNAETGTDTCSYFVFYRLTNCNPVNDGMTETGVPATTTSTTINNIEGSPTWMQAATSKSVGCAYNFDPCVKYPCPDPNAICTTKQISVYKKSTNTSLDQWISRDCSTCRLGCFRVAGSTNCVCDPCAALTCAKPGWCVNNSGVASCACPREWVFDTTSKTCIDKTKENWVNGINAYRKSNGKANLTWSDTLATGAQTWAEYLSTTLCVDFLYDPASVKLVASPESKSGGTVSETRYGATKDFTSQPAIDAWMSDLTKANAQRIISDKTTVFGCGKAACGPLGSFAVCRFTPRTY